MVVLGSSCVYAECSVSIDLLNGEKMPDEVVKIVVSMLSYRYSFYFFILRIYVAVIMWLLETENR